MLKRRAVSSPLVSASVLADRLAGPHRPALLDVRWELGQGPRRDEYRAGHIPGARFVDLDADLAAPPGPSGRHPLPSTGDFESAMRRAGVSAGTEVVAYDAATSMAAARAWWLLRYFGHGDVAVLDGGLAAWRAAGHGLEVGEPAPGPPGDFRARPGQMPVLDAGAAAALATQGRLLDARAGERFRGEAEPVDPIAGHIPAARSHPTTDNIGPDGRFLGPQQLGRAFEAAGVKAETAVGVYCGSGVTAAHEVLALAVAGFAASLYPGSWSEWIVDPERPVATGPQ